MDQSMVIMRRLCTAALFLVCFGLALISNAEAGRTHELFAQSTYYEPDGSTTTTVPSTSTETPAVVAQPVIGVGDLPVKTTTTNTEDSTSSDPVEAQTSTNVGATQDPESSTTAAQSTTVLPNTPQQQQQQHYRDFRGSTSYTTTPSQGGFMPDARPWWFNPQYANYGNYPQGGNPQQQQQLQQNTNNGVIPNRYPLGYPNQNYNPQLYSQTSNPAGGGQSLAVQANNGQYTSSGSFAAQQQYTQGGFPQYSGIVPYQLTGGGCPTQYWIANTQRWPAFFNVKSTVGDALGTPATKIYGDTTVLQALLNTRPDGYSTLLRSGVTAILNSYGRSQFKFSHVNVIESFAASLGSSQAAAEQAASFEEANVSAYSEQYNSCA